MATYIELYGLTANVVLLNRLMTAVAVLAEEIRTEPTATPNHAERVIWAKNALRNVDGTARGLIWILLAQNSSLSVAQIEGASDAALQTAVNNAVSLMI